MQKKRIRELPGLIIILGMVLIFIALFLPFVHVSLFNNSESASLIGSMWSSLIIIMAFSLIISYGKDRPLGVVLAAIAEVLLVALAAFAMRAMIAYELEGEDYASLVNVSFGAGFYLAAVAAALMFVGMVMKLLNIGTGIKDMNEFTAQYQAQVQNAADAPQPVDWGAPTATAAAVETVTESAATVTETAASTTEAVTEATATAASSDDTATA